jgi:hypothetical protein
MFRDYYHGRFQGDLRAFMPDPHVPYSGHSWPEGCGDLAAIDRERRAAFLICLYVLVDQAMHAHRRGDYAEFGRLTRYPRFCHGLGQFQKNPRAILSAPVEAGLVEQEDLEGLLSDGMELFVAEVVDFFQNHMAHISAEVFLQKILHDSDVQVPLIVVRLSPEMKNDIVVQAYEALWSAVRARWGGNS